MILGLSTSRRMMYRMHVKCTNQGSHLWFWFFCFVRLKLDFLPEILRKYKYHIWSKVGWSYKPSVSGPFEKHCLSVDALNFVINSFMQLLCPHYQSENGEVIFLSWWVETLFARLILTSIKFHVLCIRVFEEFRTFNGKNGCNILSEGSILYSFCIAHSWSATFMNDSKGILMVMLFYFSSYYSPVFERTLMLHFNVTQFDAFQN